MTTATHSTRGAKLAIHFLVWVAAPAPVYLWLILAQII